MKDKELSIVEAADKMLQTLEAMYKHDHKKLAQARGQLYLFLLDLPKAVGE